MEEDGNGHAMELAVASNPFDKLSDDIVMKILSFYCKQMGIIALVKTVGHVDRRLRRQVMWCFF